MDIDSLPLDQHIDLYGRFDHAMRNAAPYPTRLSGSDIAITGDTSLQDMAAPHVLQLEHDELRPAVDMFLDRVSASTSVRKRIEPHLVHEEQHAEGARHAGVDHTVHEMAVYNGGAGPTFQLGTLPLKRDAVTGLYLVDDDVERRAYTTAYPEKLSAGDELGLDEASLSMVAIAAIAVQRHWPMPMSMRKKGVLRSLLRR